MLANLNFDGICKINVGFSQIWSPMTHLLLKTYNDTSPHVLTTLIGNFPYSYDVTLVVAKFGNKCN